MFHLLKAYPRVIWMMALSIMISAVGESFLWPLTMTYIKETFGIPLTLASLVLLLQYAGSLLGNVFGGMLFDRFGGRKVVSGAIGSLILLLIVMGLQHNLYFYIALLITYGCLTGTFWPASRAFSTVIWPEGGRRAINAMYVANNLGVAIGAGIGGLIASVSFQYAFFGNAFTYMIFLSLFLYTIRGISDPRSASRAKKGGKDASAPTISRQKWISLAVVTFGMMVLVISYVQWQTTIPPYIKTLGVSLSSYSLLWALNGLVIVVFQPVLSFAITRFSLNLQAQIIIGAVFFVLAALLVSFFTSYIVFCLGMFIITLGEMLVWPGVPAIAAEMATPGREGFFQGIVAGGQSIGRMIGPLLGSLLFETFSPQWMLSSMSVLCLGALFCFFLYKGRGSKNSTPATQTM